MLSLLTANPILFVLYAATLSVVIAVHEFAHAWTADRLGDPTPRLQKRITLNPLAHLDPLGTLALVFVGFGWGKPVEFDPYNLRHPRRDTAVIALAGPVSNFLLAIAAALILQSNATPQIVEFFLRSIFIPLNISLGVFNLLPVHPLDGGKIVTGILPRSTAIEWEDVQHRYGFFLLLALLLPTIDGRSPASLFVAPIISGLVSLLT